MSLGVIPFSKIFLIVLFDTLTNNVSFLFLILHLFKCVALLCIVIIDIVFLLIYMCDFNFIIYMYLFSYDTRNIWVLLPRTMTIKIIFEIIKSPYWFDIRHCISLSVSYNKVFNLFCVLGGVLQTILVMYIYMYIYILSIKRNATCEINIIYFKFSTSF
jgi:hypothetical protein